MANPRTLPPIRPRITDANLYAQELTRQVLKPIMSEFEGRLMSAANRYQAMAMIELPPPEITEEIAEGVAGKNSERLLQYHRKKFATIMRSKLGVAFSLSALDPKMATQLVENVATNVALIRNVPSVLHERLTKYFTEALEERAFDAQLMAQTLHQTGEFGRARINLIARDQTSKQIGKYTELQQTEAGIETYVWSSSGDARVRPSHQNNDGQLFFWDEPPADTGHPGEDVQCRCVALGVIGLDDAHRVRRGTQRSQPAPARGQPLPPQPARRAAPPPEPPPRVPTTADYDEVEEIASEMQRLSESRSRLAASNYRLTPDLGLDAQTRALIARTDEALDATEDLLDAARKKIKTSTDDAFSDGEIIYMENPDVPKQVLLHREKRLHDTHPDYIDRDDLNDAVQYYKGAGHQTINRYLQTGNAPDDHFREWAERMVTDIKSSMKKTDRDWHVYRGLPGNPNHEIWGEEVEKLMRLRVGSTYEAKSFTSTSVRSTDALDFVTFGDTRENAVNFMFEIRIPKGTDALLYNEVESEILLNAGTKFRVLGVKKDVKMKKLDEYSGETRGRNMTINRHIILEVIEE